MKILLTNDDGVRAPGLAALRQALRPLGEIVTVAPDKEQSAVGHAITLHRPLRVDRGVEPDGSTTYAVSGTPADCVKIALAEILADDPPALVVSGVNLGPNSGVSVFYSGTVSAAFEGALMGRPALAVSLAVFEHPDFGPPAEIGARLAAMVLRNGLPPGVFLNVNVPPLPPERLRGIRVVPQARSRFVETYHRRTDPRGREYFWLDGYLEHLDEIPDTDVTSLQEGFVTVTPLRADLTDETAMGTIEAWNPSSILDDLREPDLAKPGTSPQPDPARPAKPETT